MEDIRRLGLKCIELALPSISGSRPEILRQSLDIAPVVVVRRHLGVRDQLGIVVLAAADCGVLAFEPVPAQGDVAAVVHIDMSIADQVEAKVVEPDMAGVVHGDTISRFDQIRVDAFDREVADNNVAHILQLEVCADHPGVCTGAASRTTLPVIKPSLCEPQSLSKGG